ncbi:MAG: galactose-1-phosphate uridylyltransferase [Acidobacteria bacterium]|nr:galactose-1-phosphate uridylyltransferase [Acidobacteriota bacterium]
MSELRQDPLAGDWVIVAPGRVRRPNGSTAAGRAERPGDLPAPECPFCRGRESRTPPEVWRLGEPGGDWRVRVVPNMFPALHPERTPRSLRDGGLVALDGAGCHEVVVEHPDHDWDLQTGAEREVRDVLEAYRARYRAAREAGAAAIIVFRNHGAASGNSLDHPHSQIVGMPVVPARIARLAEAARRHHEEFGTSLLADVLARETADGRRVVARAGGLVAFQPFASSSPFETWIAPEDRAPRGAGAGSFGDAPDGALDELAVILRAVLRALGRALDDPPYNLLLSGAPRLEEGGRLPWHVRIVPRLSPLAGFELATGTTINPSLPEETAVILREAVAHDS